MLISFVIGLEISQPLRSHFFFKELNLCLIRSFGGIIRAEVSELLAKGGEALGELLPYDGSAAIGIGNIAITLDRRLPAALIVLSADCDGLVSMNARLGLAVHSDICRRGDFLAADGAAVCPERIRHFVHPVLHFARTERREAARFRFQVDIAVASHIRRRIHSKRCTAVDLRDRILLDGNRDCRRIQDVAVRSGTDGACLAPAVASSHGGNIALRRFRAASKRCVRQTRVSDPVL